MSDGGKLKVPSKTPVFFFFMNSPYCLWKKIRDSQKLNFAIFFYHWQIQKLIGLQLVISTANMVVFLILISSRTSGQFQFKTGIAYEIEVIQKLVIHKDTCISSTFTFFM